MVFLGSDPPPPFKIVLPHMTFSPHSVIQSVSHFLPKLSSMYDMLPKNHMKYPLYHWYKFPVQGYVSIASDLI